MLQGTIFDIQRFSLHDGPGIRTTIFFKGCSLHCFWCHNPEGLGLKKQIQFTETRCIQCGACVVVCPEGAQELRNGVRSYNRDLCKECGKCIEACCMEALLQVGKTVSAADIMLEVTADKPFYKTSGGGVTLSGGEPALQPEFAAAILVACKAEGIHTAIETAGNVPWSNLKRLVSLSDLLMMDIKHMNDANHRTITGASNKRIIENAKHLVKENKPVIFRTPLIPTVNDNHKDIKAIGDFIAGLRNEVFNDNLHHPGISWEILSFHKLASDKYRGLGMAYEASDLDIIPKDQFYDLIATAQASGMPVKFAL